MTGTVPDGPEGPDSAHGTSWLADDELSAEMAFDVVGVGLLGVVGVGLLGVVGLGLLGVVGSEPDGVLRPPEVFDVVFGAPVVLDGEVTVGGVFTAEALRRSSLDGPQAATARPAAASMPMAADHRSPREDGNVFRGIDGKRTQP